MQSTLGQNNASLSWEPREQEPDSFCKRSRLPMHRRLAVKRKLNHQHARSMEMCDIVQGRPCEIAGRCNAAAAEMILSSVC